MKKLLVVIISLFLSGISLAQPKDPLKLPSKCLVSRPKAFNDLLLKESVAYRVVTEETNYGQNNPSGEVWEVYSDRENNTTYESPANSKKFSSLKWNQAVRIAQIKNGYAQIYEEHKRSVDELQISEEAKCLGWIPLKNLLLWQSALTSDNGIYQKALLCLNLDKNEKGVLGEGYFAPTSSGRSFDVITDMNFYFIMKRENGMALLSEQYRLDKGKTPLVLYGWVPESVFTPWNQRSCLEPTWEHQDVEFFAQKGIKAGVYTNKQKQGKPEATIPYSKKKQEYEEYLYRLDPSSLRYPILDDCSENTYNISTFTTIGGKKEVETPEFRADEELSARLEKMSHINLAIVIDGTTSMKPYYSAVKEAIKQGLKNISKDRQIKVGVVIYRDYSDGEKYLTETFPMVSIRNNQISTQLTDFLDRGGHPGTCGITSVNDKTPEEALFYGINEALSKYKFPEGESNMIMVVGDCGNDPRDTRCPTRDELVKKLVDKRIHLMAFQVRNKRENAYASFTNQMIGMIRNTFLGNYRTLSNQVMVTPKSISSGGVEIGSDFIANVQEDQRIYIGSFRTIDPAVNQGEMDPTTLTSYMENSISDFGETVQTRIDVLKSAVDAAKNKTRVIRGGNVLQQGIDISEEYMVAQLGADFTEKLTNNTLVSFRGYTDKQYENSGRNFFKPIIFISKEELQGMLRRMAPVKEAAKARNYRDREPYINALKAMLRGLSPGITDAEMATLTNEQITAMIGGLNEATPSLKSYTLADLTTMDGMEYLGIITAFEKKYEELNNIATTNYKYVKKIGVNGIPYYWIPIEKLP